MKHTKGKWWIDENRCIASGKEDNYKTIAEVLDLPDREWRANANLMVLAPEMLRLIKDVVIIEKKLGRVGSSVFWLCKGFLSKVKKANKKGEPK